MTPSTSVDSPRNPGSLVRAARAGIPAALISRRGWERLLRAARGTPRDLSPTSILLECRLDRRSSLADLSYQVDAASPWLQPLPAGVNQRLAMGWLEFDSGIDPGLAPSRFFTPAYALDPSRPSDSCRADALALLQKLETQSAASPAGSGPGAKTLGAAEQAIRRLPDGCKVRQIGLMESRTPVGLRLCLSGFDGSVSTGTLKDYLEETGYGAVAGDLARSRDGLVPLSDYLDLSIDVPPSAGDRSGWEIQLSRRNPAAEGRWTGLLEYLDGYVRLRPEKVEALLRVRGSRRMPAWEEAPPAGSAHFLVFHVNHLKLLFDRRLGPSVKAYLGVVPYQKDLASGSP